MEASNTLLFSFTAGSLEDNKRPLERLEDMRMPLTVEDGRPLTRQLESY